jgi:hypothetical protein
MRIVEMWVMFAVGVCGTAALGGPAGPIRRPDLVDDGRVLAALHEYGMTELLWAWSRDNPVPASASIAELTRQVETRRLILTSPRVSAADRLIVRGESAEILGRLIRQFSGDVQLPGWQCELAALLMSGVEPIRRAAVFEMASPAELDEMAGLLERAAAVIEPGLADLDREIGRIEKATPFNAAEYDRLDAMRGSLRRFKVLCEVGRAQIMWTRFVGPGKDQGKRFEPTLRIGRDACEKEFGELVKPRTLAEEKSPAKRSLALRSVACARLYTGESDRAAELADRVTRDATIDPLDRLEGYVIWAEAQRFANQFGGRFEVAADDVRNWPTVCSELARQANRSTRSPFKRIWELLPDDGQAAVRANAKIAVEPSGDDQARIVAGLNAVLNKAEFFAAADFVDVTLSAEGNRLRDLGPGSLTPPQLVRLNRELLDRALGASLSPGRGGVRTVLDEAEAFVASQPALRVDGLSLLRVRLAKANNLAAQEIKYGFPEVPNTSPPGVFPGGVERYVEARRAGETLIRTAVDKDPNAGPYVTMVVARMLGDAEMDRIAAVAKRQANAATQPGLPTTAGDSAGRGEWNSATKADGSELDIKPPTTQPTSQPTSQPSSQPVSIIHFFRFPTAPKPPEEGPTPGKIVLAVVLSLLCLACVAALRRSRFRRGKKR